MTAIPIVAIAVPAEVAPDLAAMVLRTCNLALGLGHCTLEEPVQTTQNVSWLAHVGMDPLQPNLLRIELRDAMPRNTRTTYSRWLDFEISDPPSNRWSTVGVVVAALVISAEAGKSHATASTESGGHDSRRGGTELTGDAERRQAHSPVTAVPPTKSKPRSNEDGRANPSLRRQPDNPANGKVLRLDLGGVVGAGVEDHAWRYGLSLRPSVALTPHVLLCSRLGVARARDSISVLWLSGAAGLGWAAELIPRWIAIEARFELHAEHLEFKVTDAAGVSDSESRWRFGLGAGVDTLFPLADPVGWFVAVDGLMANPRVKIREAGAAVGQTPTAEAMVTVGLRWRIPFGR